MVEDSPLGKKTASIETYTPGLLYPVARLLARNKLGIDLKNLPFHGFDLWNGFEFSWLNLKGKPQIALLLFEFPCDSPYIVESKSLKLYLNSFIQSRFDSKEQVEATLRSDIESVIEAKIGLKLLEVSDKKPAIGLIEGKCLDSLDIEVSSYSRDPSLLQVTGEKVKETLYSHLLKSNCMATGQPDWGTLVVNYEGPAIDPSSLLKYIISYRSHVGFAEHCVEQIYVDILEKCKPKKLTVYARYTRRGGLDINPVRSNFEKSSLKREDLNIRLVRQ